MRVVTYKIGNEIQAPKTMDEAEIQWLRAFAKTNPEIEIVRIRTKKTTTR